MIRKLFLVAMLTLPVAAVAAGPSAEAGANGDYRAVRVSELSQHIGKQVRLSLPRGVVREGTLAEANPSTITVEQQYRRGQMKFEVLSKQVEKAEVRD